MPLDHIKLQDQIHTFISSEVSNHQQVEPQIAQALEALDLFSSNISWMKISANKAEKRVAVPFTEKPSDTFPPPSHAASFNLVCSDGSQIFPDPYNEPNFALVNIGIITIPADPAQAIKPEIISELYQHEKLYKNNELINEARVNLYRDVMEMECLLKVCKNLNSPTIALRDGLLELYHDPRVDSDFQKENSSYQNYLEEMRSAETMVIPAGYVDNPHSQSVLYLLRLCKQEKEKSTDLFFPQLIDRQLFEKKLKSGERSAIFENRLPARQDAALYFFFYLNVSSSGKPCIVRVEIPNWVAENPEQVDMLHFALLEQCAIMGTKPYPYCLYRAHETALVSQQEKDELGKHILSEAVKAGLPNGGKSAKQSAKDLSRLKLLERKR